MSERVAHDRVISNSLSTLELAHRRLEDLYEISKVFSSFENAERPLDPVLSIVSRTLPLYSAILIETDEDRSAMIAWSAEGRRADHMSLIKERARTACTYLIGAEATAAMRLTEYAGKLRLPRRAECDVPVENRLIVIPLVVAYLPTFGVLQLEAARHLDETDLMFVNAIANQLAIALDRERAWRRDITRREYAEDARLRAELSAAAAERQRIAAEDAKEQSAALAHANSRLYEQAQQAVRAREQVLALVSHDLKNPLGTILLTADILEDPHATEERKRTLAQAVARIRRVARGMLRLIDDLLDFASIEAGTFAIKRQSHDPNALVQEALSSFAGLAEGKHTRLLAEAAPQIPSVFCDRDRILQVLSNLIGNAIKATPDDGNVTVRVEAQLPERVSFAVSDDGPGIGEEDQKHLFDRYWRGNNAEYKGTGLGLAIASALVAAHDSTLHVKSALGHGTTFHFTLSARDDSDTGPT